MQRCTTASWGTTSLNSRLSSSSFSDVYRMTRPGPVGACVGFDTFCCSWQSFRPDAAAVAATVLLLLLRSHPTCRFSRDVQRCPISPFRTLHVEQHLQLVSHFHKAVLPLPASESVFGTDTSRKTSIECSRREIYVPRTSLLAFAAVHFWS